MKNIIISTNTQTPIYKQIYDQISLQILGGLIESESLLPSIRNIAKELRVSIITIKKTWEMLEQNGYIYTIPGKGSYVAIHTNKTINEKKQDILKTSLSSEITLAKSLGYSKDDLLQLIEQIFSK